MRQKGRPNLRFISLAYMFGNDIVMGLPMSKQKRTANRFGLGVAALAVLVAGACVVEGKVDEGENDPLRDGTASSLPAAVAPSGYPGAPGLGDSFYPQLGNGGYDVLHYAIQLDVDPIPNTIQAQTTIIAAATQDLSAFNLDLAGLTVESVLVNDNDAEFSRQDTELTITPDATLLQGEEFSTKVTYSGSPMPLSDPGVPFSEIGWHNREGLIYTASEPSGSMSWFPSNNHPTDKATFEIQITVPSTFTAAASGVLVNETQSARRTTTTWQMDDPMATYLTAVYVGDFERVENRQADGLLIRDYVPREHFDVVVDALAETPQMIEYFEGILGPYPYAVYGSVVMPFPLGYALENQTLSLPALDTIDPLIVAHEISHQWIGNSSTVDDWSEIWLHEGFATYLTSMYLAEHHGQDINEDMRRNYAFMSEPAAVAPQQISQGQLFDASVYLRGALTLHALRQFVGDDLFTTILRTHYQQSINANTNTAEFLAIVRRLANQEAADLVEQWLNNALMPPLPPPLTPPPNLNQSP